MRRSGCLGGLLAVSLVLASCGGGSSGAATNVQPPTTAATEAATSPDPTELVSETTEAPVSTEQTTTTVDPTVAATEEIRASLAEVAALDGAEQEARVRKSAAELEATFLAMTGIEGALGADAAAAMTEYAEELIAQRDAAQLWIESEPTFGTSFRGIGRLRQDTAGLGSVIATTMMTAGLLTSAVLQATASGPVSGKGEGLSVDGDRGSVTMEMEGNKTSGAVTGGMRVKVDLKPCPDVNGEVEATINVTAHMSGGGRGGNVKMVAQILGHVDDDAVLAGTDVEATVEGGDYSTSSSGSTTNENTWLQAQLGYGLGTSSSNTHSGLQIPSKTPSMSDQAAIETANSMNLMLMMIVQQTMSEAEKAWQNGRCVKLEPTTDPGERTGLEPDETVSIQAAPRSLIDGGPIGGSVTATLKSGAAMVEPSGQKVKPDATFTYTAPPEREKDGEVQLEARSKRGAVKATLVFDTKGHTYSFMGDVFGTSGSGLKCSGETGDWVIDLSGSPGGYDTDMHLVISIGEDLAGSVALTWTWSSPHGSGGGQASGPAFVEVDADGVATALKVGPFSYNGSGVLVGVGVGGSGSTDVFTFPVVHETVICS